MNEYPHPFFNEKGKLICQICGKSFLVISPRHLQTHKIKYADYTKRFPQAPLSSDEFIARGKYGKNKNIFPLSEIGEEHLVEEDYDPPDVEDIEIEKFLTKQIPLSPMEAMKSKFLDHIRMYFANVKKDYFVRQLGKDGNLKFEFITDFCDPVLKVVIQFPDTFWHNSEAALDPNKNYKLSQFGWKVIEIPSSNPKLETIDQYLMEE